MRTSSGFSFHTQALALLAVLLLSACATRIRLPEGLEPERLLPTGAMAYLNLKPAKLSDLIQPLLEPYGMARPEDIVKRTENIVLAIMPGAADSSPGASARMEVYGVASGSFPTGSLALKLNTDRQWTRNGPGWVHKQDGLNLALTSRGQIVLGTGPLETLLSEGSSRAHPIPEIWSLAWDNDLAVYLPEPLSSLGSSLPVDLSGLPLVSLLLSVREMESRYSLYMGFEFPTERAAVVFAPLCRLFLYALTMALWPDQAPELLGSLTWSTQGLTVGATGLRLEAGQLAWLLSLPFGQAAADPFGLKGGK